MSKLSKISKPLLSASSASQAIALIIVFSSASAFAQDAKPEEVKAEEVISVTEDDTAENKQDVIIVTGSRIKRSGFNNPDPVTIIDPELSKARGQSTVSEMLQSSPIAAGSSQITSAISSAFVTNGGSGAETISLRGLGAERTLVLMNGRRAGPAGTRGGVSSFDLNVLPQSIVKSVEILKTGASSVYGSDAVAGVVNLITKTDTNGLELDAFVSVPTKTGGEITRLTGTWGDDFGNGHLMVSLDYYKRNELKRGQREYLDCPEEYIFRRDGSRADIVDPRTGKFRCNDTVWGHNWVYDGNTFARRGLYQFSYPGDNLGSYIAPNLPAGFTVPAGFFRIDVDTASQAVTNAYHPFMQQETVIPESERFTGYLDGALEISDTLKIGTELLFNRRKTAVDSYRQFYYNTGYTSNFDGTGFGDPFSPGWAGTFYISPTAITDHADSNQRVDYYRAVGYVDGSFGSMIPTWSYNGYVQYSRSQGQYTNDIIFNDAVNLHNYRTSSQIGTTTPISKRTVTQNINWTTPAFLRGDLSAYERSFLFGVDTGNTTYTQLNAEFSTSGTLLKLPAGDLNVAIGATVRQDQINDTPGEQTRLGNAWNSSSAGITAGKSLTKEAFAEIDLPLIYNTPAMQSFSINASGRITSVKATRASDGVFSEDNGNLTYSVGANWEVTNWLRFRGRYGTSFRAPALFEQFLSNQTSGATQRSIDPCIGWANNLALSRITQRLADNCRVGTATVAGVPGNHSGGGIGATVTTGGGLGVLESETSSAKTASIILTPKFSFLPNTKISLAVDYFDIEIKGEIATLSPGSIISGCYNSEFFPTDPLCSLFTRFSASEASQFNIKTATATFININKQRNEGIDVTADIRQDLGKLGSFNFVAQMTWQLRDEVALFNNTLNDLNGEVGEPRWVGDFDFVWRPDDSLTLTYGVDVIGSSDDIEDYNRVFNITDQCRVTAIYGTYCADLTAEARFYHSLSISKALDKFNISLGVANLFDQKPPRTTISGSNSLNGGQVNNIGNSVLSSQYDYIGRRLFMGVTARF